MKTNRILILAFLVLGLFAINVPTAEAQLLRRLGRAIDNAQLRNEIRLRNELARQDLLGVGLGFRNNLAFSRSVRFRDLSLAQEIRAQNRLRRQLDFNDFRRAQLNRSLRRQAIRNDAIRRAALQQRAIRNSLRLGVQADCF
jgi:hypothetical protein